ncbi:hypothetical protein FOZ61_010031 [Perkinsus olseni]|uniref:F-box/LRR-repeat protein 15/At3g58940/PEG3-like LRR domain-containing protein n=1 Tax=Perkinsus olseni TaxID=32597 RepID=A0A7J6M3Y5_PEROL|nr:hypothetical protein FOZ61_010031 [Perkinsus olseni]KAF4672489.1 hypothetical protein FOL46_008882 [Perkinsus olseni]
MSSEEVLLNERGSLLNFNDELLVSVFLWLLEPEDVTHRHILPITKPITNISSVVDTNGDEGEVVMTSKEESGPDREHLADTLGGRGATTLDGIRASAPNGAQPLKAAVLTGREVLRSLCSRTRRIIDSLCGVLSIRLKDLVDGGVVNDYVATSATLPSRITCLNYIFDLTGVHSTSLRGPLNTIVNFINTTTYTPGEVPSRTTALLTPPARVHLLNINPWMLEPSGRCIRDVLGVVRDVEENNKSCFAQHEGDAFNDRKKTRGGLLYASRRIEIVRMTLSGFIIHQQELPPLKITLNNLRFLSLTYCTIPLSGHASPVAVRQVPWLPSMPVLESLELRHIIAVDASGGPCGTMAADQGGLPIGSTELADALLEGILHRLPSLKDLFIDSSASIVSPDIAANAPRLEHLTLSHCPRLRPISVEKAARECKGLKLLDIRTLSHLANEVHSHALVGIECLRLPPGVKEEYLKPILSRDRDDDHRSCHYSRCLQSLTLSEIDDIDLSVADVSLQTLFLSRSERMPLPSISSFTAGQHLRYLSISFCRLDPARFRVSGTFSNLEILSLHNVVYSRNQLSLLLASTPSLTALDIALCDQATTRQRDANAPRDELEPLRVPGSNPPIPLKFPRLRYLRISGSKRVHYSAIVPSIISNASVLEQLELLKIPPVYSISSPSPRLASITVSLVPPTPSTRVRLVRDILNDSTADGGQKLLLQHYEKSEVDLFVAALTRQCWSMKSLVLSGCCLQQPLPPLIHNASSHASTLMRMVREYEAMMGDESMLIPSGRDTRLMIVRDHIQAALNQDDCQSLASSQTACDTRNRPSSKRSSDAYDTAIAEGDGEGTVLGNSTSDDNHTPGHRLSDEDNLMLEVIIQQTTAVALGLLARLVAVNEIMYSTNQQQGQARAPTATTPYSTLETSPTPTSPAHAVQRRSDGRVENDDEDYGDDEDEALPQVIEMTSPTAMTPPSPDVADQGEGALPTPPPPSISVAPHPPALHTIQQLLLMHRMPMSGLELDAPVGSTEWDPCYKETMAVLMSAPVRTAFRILAGDARSMGLDAQEMTVVEEGHLGAAELNREEAACHNRESPERGHPSLSDARHRAVYEYGKAYQSMMNKFISMRTAQVTVMSQLPERQQQQMLWKGLLIQSTGAYTREGAYSAKIMTHRKTLLRESVDRYKQSPRELQDYLSSRKLVNEELAALLRRRLARVPQTDRWGARCRPPEDREVDIIAGCLRNALTPAGVIGGGIAILPLREGASYLPKLFENLPIHLMAPLLVDRLTASSSSSPPNTGYQSSPPSADVGLVSQFCELMEMCISMHIQYDTIELKQPGYHVLQTAIAEANALDRSTRGPLPTFPIEVQDNLPLIRVGVAMVSTAKAELEARKRPVGEASSQRLKTAVHRLLMSLTYGRLDRTYVTRLEELPERALVGLLRTSINQMAVSLLRLGSGKENTAMLQRAFHTSIQDPPWWNGSLEALKLKYPVVSRLINCDRGSELCNLDAFKGMRNKFQSLVVLQVEVPEPGLSKLREVLDDSLPSPVSGTDVRDTQTACITLLPRVRTLLSPHGNGAHDEDSAPPAKRTKLTKRRSSEDSREAENGLQRHSSDISVATTTRVSQRGVSTPTLHFNSVDTEWYRSSDCCNVADNVDRLQWEQQQQHPCWERDASLT